MGHHHSNFDEHNLLLPLVVAPIVFLAAGLCFDFYYQLNDDVVIKDILSGAYTGTPEGYTNQLLVPLGIVLARVYRLFPELNVFAGFLMGCLGLCFYLIGHRSLKYYKTYFVKLLLLLFEAGIFLSMFLWELVYIQYSVVCGVMVATACFWFYTTDMNLSVGEFWYANLPALVLVWLAFGLRSEMVLLMTPYLCVVGVYHWSRQVKEENTSLYGGRKKKWIKRVLGVENCRKYLLFALVAAAGWGLLLAVDYFANSADDWKAYRRFFDARTKVYDYTWYPAYEENQEFYESIGVSPGQYELIDEYNFALDPSIDTHMLEDIASFDERAKHRGSLSLRLKNGVWELVHRMVSFKDAPYNYFVIAAYAMVAVLAVLQRQKGYIWKLLLLAAVRVVPWMYLILAERVVERIAHPLYLAEFLCLMALLVKELHDRPLWNVEKLYRRVVLAVLTGLTVLGGLIAFPRVAEEKSRREQVNETMEEFQKYTQGKPDNYYYLDVYSTVAYSEKLFEEDSNERKNYDILGGWVCHSPLQIQVLEEYAGNADVGIARALFMDNFYFCINSQRETDFLTMYYEALETPVELTEIDRVGEGDDVLIIYRVEPLNGEQDI